MGKKKPQQQSQHLQSEDEVSSGLFWHKFLAAIVQIFKGFDLKCTIILALSLSIFVFGFFWALPLQHVKTGFDANDSIKLGAVSIFLLFSCFIYY